MTHAVTTNSLSSAETNRTPVDRVDETDCCIVGAGPGGVFLALLLARAGVRVVLLEAHCDFDRDYRGEGLQPPTLEILDQLGLLDRFLQLPHSRIPRMVLRTPVGPVTFLDPGKVSARHPYLVYVAQPRLLEFVAAEAERFATFRLVRGARVDRVIQEQGVIRGVNYKQGGTNVVIRASLVVGADGRFSKIRQLSSLELEAHGAAIDMIWFRLPRQPEDTPAQAGIYAGSRGGAYGVAVYRGEQWQIGLAFPKGTYQQLRASGLETVRDILGEIIPWITDRLDYLQDWAQTAVLSVESSRVRTWHRPGLLLIGVSAVEKIGQLSG